MLTKISGKQQIRIQHHHLKFTASLPPGKMVGKEDEILLGVQGAEVIKVAIQGAV